MNILKKLLNFFQFPSFIFYLSSLNSQLSTRRGFTLIELLVVFSLITILSGIGVVSFASYSQAQQVSQATSDVRGLINEARFDALSSVTTNKSTDGNIVTCGNNSLIGYSVEVSTGEISLFQKCENVESVAIKNIFLARNIKFDNSTTCTIVSFASLSAQADGVPCNIVVTGYGHVSTISIDEGGNFSVN
jgi:prepilin-type N-terminal cleavage/methylation domain-containing protein